MTTLLRIHLASLLMLVCIGYRAQNASAQFENGHWLSDFGGYLPTDNRIKSVAYDAEGRLFLAGDFSHVQGMETGGVARWHDREVDPLLSQWAGGTKIAVVGGQPLVFGTQAEYFPSGYVNYFPILASWDGNAWHKRSGDLFSSPCLIQVWAIVEHQNEIYIGGNFRTTDGSNNIGRLTDTGWDGLGAGMTGPFIYDCLFADVTAIVGEPDGSLLVGGEFDEVAGMPAKYLVRWDGETWQTVESEPPGPVDFMVSDGHGGLFLAGTEESTGWPYTSWIGQWSAIGFALLPSIGKEVEAIHRRQDDTFLVSGPSANNQYNAPTKRLSEWSGAEWIEFGEPLIGEVWQIGDTPSGDLFIAGNFTTVGPTPVVNFAVWNGQDWEGLLSDTNQGPDRTVLDMVPDPDGRGVIVAGDFLSVAGQPIRYVGRWTESSWEAVGGPLDGSVSSLEVAKDGTLIASGRFTSDDQSELGGIARLVGGKWLPVEGVIDGPIWASTSCPNGDIVMATTSRQILRWDGTSVDTVGHSVHGWVEDLACGQDTTLYVGGDFESVDGVDANNVAAWSDGTWYPLGPGVDGWVRALAVDEQNRLYVGGHFGNAGGQPVNRLAMWDGNWSEVGGGVNSTVYALAIDALGRLYVGGGFTTAGSLEVDKLAVWSGTDGWSAPSPGLEGGNVESLAVIGNDLWVGGTFTSAGGQPSNRLAVYAGITTTQTEPGEAPDNIGTPDVAVFPNPAVAGSSATIELSSTVPGRVSVDVYDVLGRRVTSVFDGWISTTGQRLSLNTGGFVPGLYLVQVRANGAQVVGTQSFLVR